MSIQFKDCLETADTFDLEDLDDLENMDEKNIIYGKLHVQFQYHLCFTHLFFHQVVLYDSFSDQ